MAVQQAMTLEQFFVWESTQELKHEYCRGRVLLHNVSMPGASTPHNRIERNLVGVLYATFRGSECEIFTSNQTIMSVLAEVGFYPDVSLFCEPLQKRRYGTIDAAINPAAVFEVASPSTRRYDETYKLETYRAMPSMREVFLVSTDEAKVERWFRVDDVWRSETVEGTTNRLTVLGQTIGLGDVYEKVEFGIEEG